MSVPETPMYKNDRFVFGKNDIGFTSQKPGSSFDSRWLYGMFPAMKPKSKAVCMQKLSYQHLRFGVFRPDAAHDVTALLWGKIIGHLYKFHQKSGFNPVFCTFRHIFLCKFLSTSSFCKAPHMKLLFSFSLLFFTFSTMAQVAAVKTHAYSRETIPGVPPVLDSAGQPTNNPFPIQYFLFVSVKKGTPVSVKGCWLNNKYFAARLKKIKTPIIQPKNPAVPSGEMDTLVQKTNEDVYEVVLGNNTSWVTAVPVEKTLIRNNECVVFLRTGKKNIYGSAKTIKQLIPLAMP
jgi:hypothetical protein